jgi:hypothetical protein
MAKDVLITPASGLIQFYDADGNVDATIQLDDANVLNISGTVSLGDLAADVYIGDGVNEVDIIFEQNGAVRALAGKTLTLGQANSNISFAGNITSGANIAGNVTAGNLSVAADITGSRIFSTSNGQGTNYSVGDDAWIGDINQADTISIRGRQNAANAYIVFGNATVAQLGRSGTGPLTYSGAFSATGNVTGGNIATAGLISVTGNVTAVGNIQGNYFVGNGSLLTGISGGSSVGGTFQVIARSGSITVVVASGFFSVVTRNSGSRQVAVA